MDPDPNATYTSLATTLTIEEHQFDVLIDTGSFSVFMSMEMYDTLPEKDVIAKRRTRK